MRTFKEESGQVLLMTALSMVLLLGFVGFATDVGVLLHEKRIVQTAADSAAIAAATEALKEGASTSVTTGMWAAAANDATLNGFTPGSSNGARNTTTGTTLTINAASDISISEYQSAGNFQAIVTQNTPTIFMGAFGAMFGMGSKQGGANFGAIDVSASAIASDTISSNGCGQVQNYDNLADPAVTMGGSSEVFAINCGIDVNGNVDMGGNANITAAYLEAEGSITNGGNSNITGGPISQNLGYPSPDPYSSKLQDPTNQPTPGTSANGPCGSTPAGTTCIYNYNNGVLSGDLNPNKLPSVVYYFDSLVNNGGGPTVSGTVTGSNVTIYLADNIPLDFSNNGSLTLYPPGYGGSCLGSTNPFCGILIDAPTDGAAGNGTYTCSHGRGNNYGNPGEIYFDFGSSTTDLEGVVYAPYMQLFIQDQGASTTLGINFVIGNFCAQAATLNIKGYSGPQSPATRVGLIF